MFTFNTLSFQQNALNEIEQVQQQKTEFKLIDSFYRNKSLQLFAYDFENDVIHLVKTEIQKEDCQLEIVEGKLVPKIANNKEKVVVVSNSIYFEALNLKNAEKRVSKWKQGDVKTLCNLRPKQHEKYEKLLKF